MQNYQQIIEQFEKVRDLDSAVFVEIPQRKIVEPLISECSDDLDKLVALYDGIIPLHSRTNFELNVRTRVKNLLPFAMVQCNGSVDELGKLRERLGYYFKEEFNEAVKDSLQAFINGCGGDFGKHVALYNMVSPECQEVMRSLLKMS